MPTSKPRRSSAASEAHTGTVPSGAGRASRLRIGRTLSAPASSIGRAMTVSGNPSPGIATSWNRTESARATPSTPRITTCAGSSRKLVSPDEPARTYRSAGRMRCIHASSELRNE